MLQHCGWAELTHWTVWCKIHWEETLLCSCVRGREYREKRLCVVLHILMWPGTGGTVWAAVLQLLLLNPEKHYQVQIFNRQHAGRCFLKSAARLFTKPTLVQAFLHSSCRRRCTLNAWKEFLCKTWKAIGKIHEHVLGMGFIMYLRFKKGNVESGVS